MATVGVIAKAIVIVKMVLLLRFAITLVQVDQKIVDLPLIPMVSFVHYFVY